MNWLYLVPLILLIIFLIVSYIGIVKQDKEWEDELKKEK